MEYVSCAVLQQKRWNRVDAGPVALFSSSLLIASLISSTVSRISEMVDGLLASPLKAKGKEFLLVVYQ